MENKISFYSRINKVKVGLNKANLKKSGLNKYSGFKYYELGDFMPMLNELCEQHGVFTYFEMQDNEAVLSIIDCENPENVLTQRLEARSVEVKGAQEIQKMGAQQTYLRRYIYMNAFDIVESDMIDAQEQAKQRQQQQEQAKANQQAYQALKALETQIKGAKNGGHLEQLLIAANMENDQNSKHLKKLILLRSSELGLKFDKATGKFLNNEPAEVVENEQPQQPKQQQTPQPAMPHGDQT